MTKDWTGNKVAPFTSMGARNYAKEEREESDFYATEPKAIKLLLEQETFHPLIWECACGHGHISSVLKANGYQVINSDIVYRGYSGTTIFDFLKDKRCLPFTGDIITNPPYKYASEFVKRALEYVEIGNKVAMFLKITFLEGKERGKNLFSKYPPKRIYVSRSRLVCAKNGEFDKTKGSAIAYAWYVWEKGFVGDPIIKWIN